ncbi:hypothetical protein ABZ471_40815 [Streptomyces sp. NPDC005728]|uniref:hypothetical protein n=1 Tax=Streptomyces sp. NPDC005728 TaxID=3157054 RepID=UPI0033C56123
MSRENDAACLVWEVQLYEPFSRVWISKGYGRATTDADPAAFGRAVLAGHLARGPARRGETFRALVRTANDDSLTVTADELRTQSRTVDPALCQMLPTYLRDTLT